MKTKPYPMHHPRFWSCYWTTMRPYLLFVSGAAGVAGLAAGSDLTFTRALLAFAVFFLSYGFGQALTDCFQLDTDAISSPYRPMVRGLVTRNQVLLVSLAGCGLCCLILTLLDIRTLVPAALCVGGLSTYTWFKRRWWGGPFYNAWIVALLPVMGLIISRGPEETVYRAVTAGAAPWVLLSILLSYANFVLMGYLKDISADRQSGYNTFPVAFGWRKTVLAGDLLAVASLAATATALLSVTVTLSAQFFYLLAVVALAVAQIGAHRVDDEDQAHRPIGWVVRGFVLLRMAETAAVKPEWTIGLILFYSAFELVLLNRPEKRQV